MLLWPRGRAAAADDRIFSTGAIIFMLNGGARTQALFNGSVATPANPFNLSLATAPGDIVRLSPLMSPTVDDRLVTYLNKYVNLVATCQHPRTTGNHMEDRVIAATGFGRSENRPGILAILNREFPFRPVPCVSIGPDNPTTGVGSEIAAPLAPLVISNPKDIGTLQQGVTWELPGAEDPRLDTLRYAIEDAYHRNTAWAAPEAIPVFQRQAEKIAQQLGMAPLDPTATAGLMTPFGSFLGNYDDGIYPDEENTPSVTNARLRAMCGATTTAATNDFDVGTQAVLAIRLRQLGCAGITISSPENYDLHNNEDNQDTGLPRRAARLARAVAGLIRALSDIRDPYVADLTLLDTTIITFVTDFNRGNWGADGYNVTNGSDHAGGDIRTATQCIPIIGGKDFQNGRVLGSVTSNSGAPASGSKTYGTRQVLATVLEFVGAAPEPYFPGVPTLREELK